MTKYSLDGTNRVRDIGLATAAGSNHGSGKKPKPGDIYALLNHGVTDKKTAGYRMSASSKKRLEPSGQPLILDKEADSKGRRIRENTKPRLWS